MVTPPRDGYDFESRDNSKEMMDNHRKKKKGGIREVGERDKGAKSVAESGRKLESGGV